MFSFTPGLWDKHIIYARMSGQYSRIFCPFHPSPDCVIDHVTFHSTLPRQNVSQKKFFIQPSKPWCPIRGLRVSQSSEKFKKFARFFSKFYMHQNSPNYSSNIHFETLKKLNQSASSSISQHKSAPISINQHQ